MKDNFDTKLIVVTALGAAGLADMSSDYFMNQFGGYKELMSFALAITTAMSFATLLQFAFELAFDIDGYRRANILFKVTAAMYYFIAVLGLVVFIAAPRSEPQHWVFNRFGLLGYIVYVTFGYLLVEIGARVLKSWIKKRKIISINKTNRQKSA